VVLPEAAVLAVDDFVYQGGRYGVQTDPLEAPHAEFDAFAVDKLAVVIK